MSIAERNTTKKGIRGKCSFVNDVPTRGATSTRHGRLKSFGTNLEARPTKTLRPQGIFYLPYYLTT